MLDKKQIWAIFLLEFKMGGKTPKTTCSINNTFGPGTANKHTMQWWLRSCLYVPQLPYPFVCWWASRLLPCTGYYKQCCGEHWGARVSFRSGFLSVYTQEWVCWVIWQFYFQLFFFFIIVVGFVIHWNESAMGLHVFPIPIPPPTSLSTRSP